MIEHAKAKLKRKGSDWIVANDVSAEGGAMGGDDNAVHLIVANGAEPAVEQPTVESWPSQSKDGVARALVARIAHRLECEAMSDVVVHVKRLPHGAGLPLPSYQSDSAAGLDLIAAVPAGAPIVIAPGRYAAVPTGIAIALPAGTEAQVRPRSGLALRHGVTVLNSPGTVDADYRGEIQVLLVNHGAAAVIIERGMRIAQLVIASVLRARLSELKDLDDTQRGAGGFGSTGGGIGI